MQRKFTFSLVVSSLLAGALYADTNAMSQNSTNAENNATGGGALTDIRTYQLGAVEITAPQQVDFNPTAVVVSRKDIEKTASTNMGHALRFTPGVFFVSNVGRDIIYIRGQDEDQIGYYLDGIPINDGYRRRASSYTYFDSFSTWGLSEISVSKGYTSPAFNALSQGGAINMITGIPTKDLEVDLGYTFIADNENRVNLRLGRNLGDTYFQILYSQMDRKSLNYSYDYAVDLNSLNAFDIPNTQKKFRVLHLKYGWMPNANHDYSVNFRYQKQKFDYWWNWINYDATTLYILGTSRFNDFVSLDSKVYYHMNLNATLDSAKYDDYTTGLVESVKLDFSQNQNLKVGVNVKHDSHKHIDNDLQDMTRVHFQTLNSSAFAEYALKFNDMFRFVLSSSYDRSDGLNIRQRQVTGSGTSKTASEMKKQKNLHMQGWSLQGILYMQPIDPLLLHANVGKKTNLPHIGKLYGDTYGQNAPSSNLRSESAINYELGADFNYKIAELGTMQWGITGFYNDLTDMMISTYTDGSQCENPFTSGGNSYCWQYQNADTGYIYGGEVFIKQGFWADKFVLGANWSYTQRKSYNYDNNGNRISTTEFVSHPRQNINLNVLLAPRKEYDVSLSGSVQTSRYARVGNGTDANPYDYVRIPTVVYFDMIANYYIKENFKLSLGAYNLFDRNYNYSSSQTSAAAGGLPGRRVFTSLEYRY